MPLSSSSSAPAAAALESACAATRDKLAAALGAAAAELARRGAKARERDRANAAVGVQRHRVRRHLTIVSDDRRPRSDALAPFEIPFPKTGRGNVSFERGRRLGERPRASGVIKPRPLDAYVAPRRP